ncbi:MAG: glycosyltransferase [Planctomycetota bacterium]
MEPKQEDTLHVAVVFERLGPYHLARLAALAKRARVTAIEIVRKDKLYQWDVVDSPCGFKRVTLFNDEAYSSADLVKRLCEELDGLRPDAVAIPSWGRPASWTTFRWALQSRTATVLMTESQFRDAPRVAWKEYIKRQMVAYCGAGLVGGQRQIDYMVRLGMEKSRVFTGYDVVENDYFSAGADQARVHAKRLREELKLPEKYFLTSSRFVPKKNIVGLLTSYSMYRKNGAPGDWKLVVLGDGPTRPEVERCISDQNLEGHVLLPGFKQYADLPVYYGLGGAFVLASSTEQWGLVVNEAMAAGLPVLISEACGCAPDLVKDGVNGFVFDYRNPNALAEYMRKLASGECDLSAMANASRTIVADYTPESYAEGFMRAARTARGNIPASTIGQFVAGKVAGMMIKMAQKEGE